MEDDTEKHEWGCVCFTCMENRLLKRTGINMSEIDETNCEKEVKKQKVVNLLDWKKKRRR